MSRFERWSRRKLGEEAEQAPEREPVGALDKEAFDKEAFDKEAFDKEPVEPEPAAPGSLDHTLPDPDELSAGANFSAYLKQGVSRQLRRRALRRLWSAGNYGIRDGLDDYDENYREVLKPLAQDMAEQLRRWTRPAEQTPSSPYEHDNDAEDTTHEDASPSDVAAENGLDEEPVGGDNRLS